MAIMTSNLTTISIVFLVIIASLLHISDCHSVVQRRQANVASDCDSTGPLCINDCTGQVGNRAYQLCSSCDKAIYCFDQQNFQVIQCPPNNIWDDCQKQCILSEVSRTCVECFDADNPGDIVFECTESTPAPTPPPALCRGTGASCISNCNAQQDGFYQWCGRCDYYVACVAQNTIFQPCPFNSPWDDCNKRCDVISNTCTECDNNNDNDVDCSQTDTTTAVSTVSTTEAIECESTGETCVRPSSCGSLSNGDYQYCGNCHQFVTCADSGGYVLPCSVGLWWDDNLKNCDRESTTCLECYFTDPTTSSPETTEETTEDELVRLLRRTN